MRVKLMLLIGLMCVSTKMFGWFGVTIVNKSGSVVYVTVDRSKWGKATPAKVDNNKKARLPTFIGGPRSVQWCYEPSPKGKWTPATANWYETPAYSRPHELTILPDGEFKILRATLIGRLGAAAERDWGNMMKHISSNILRGRPGFEKGLDKIIRDAEDGKIAIDRDGNVDYRRELFLGESRTAAILR